MYAIIMNNIEIVCNFTRELDAIAVGTFLFILETVLQSVVSCFEVPCSGTKPMAHGTGIRYILSIGKTCFISKLILKNIT
jgi:hypothetical protein